MNAAEKLCLACGLCCDGSLFGHVRLGPEDDARRLKAAGLPVTVSRGAERVVRFRQPCAALGADCRCAVYAERPGQCRRFECGIYKDAVAGRIEFPAALRLVKKARRQADTVHGLLRALGDTTEERSLGERFRRVLRRMETDGGDAAAADAFAELGLAMHAFTRLAEEKFHTRPGTA